MRRFGVSIVDAGDQGYVDIASPPPPPPQVGSADDWSNPYGYGGGQVGVSSPPLVAVSASQPSGGTSTWDSWFGKGQQVLTGLVDIFGRPVAQAPVAQPTGMPLWGIVALGVGGIVVLGLAARSLKSRRYAGYKRRHRR